MGTNTINYGNPDEEAEFAIEMAAKLRTAARAADELAVSYRELARRLPTRSTPILPPTLTRWDFQSASRSERSTSKDMPSSPRSMNAGPPQIRP
jgi:hypothetical protein